MYYALNCCSFSWYRAPAMKYFHREK